MSGVFGTIIHQLGSRVFDLIVVLCVFFLTVLVSLFALFLLKYFGFFEIKDPKLNEQLAEADTDFYRKNSGFCPDPKEAEVTLNLKGANK
ncbi:MAG: hypothetical protein ABSE48_15685 [Verrucomicrobiota bacterium]|jgi:hypothetical protein